MLPAQLPVEGMGAGPVLCRGDHDPAAAGLPGKGLDRPHQLTSHAPASSGLGDDQCREQGDLGRRVKGSEAVGGREAQDFSTALGDQDDRAGVGRQALEAPADLLRWGGVAESRQQGGKGRQIGGSGRPDGDGTWGGQREPRSDYAGAGPVAPGEAGTSFPTG